MMKTPIYGVGNGNMFAVVKLYLSQIIKNIAMHLDDYFKKP